MKFKNKFYVGAEVLANPNSRYLTSEADAIASARQLVSERGRPMIVVKIVAVIEPDVKPTKVTRIK